MTAVDIFVILGIVFLVSMSIGWAVHGYRRLAEDAEWRARRAKLMDGLDDPEDIAAMNRAREIMPRGDRLKGLAERYRPDPTQPLPPWVALDTPEEPR